MSLGLPALEVIIPDRNIGAFYLLLLI